MHGNSQLGDYCRGRDEEEGSQPVLGDAKITISAEKNATQAASGSFPLKLPQRVSRRNFTSFLAAIVGSIRVVCTPLL